MAFDPYLLEIDDTLRELAVVVFLLVFVVAQDTSVKYKKPILPKFEKLGLLLHHHAIIIIALR